MFSSHANIDIKSRKIFIIWTIFEKSLRDDPVNYETPKNSVKYDV